MNNKTLVCYIKECEEEYKRFMRISKFPRYEIVAKELSEEKLNAQGFETLATASYDFEKKLHILTVWSKLNEYDNLGDNIIFHELTHIYDYENYTNDDIKKHLVYHAYTEYHASQVQLMKLLGARDIRHTIEFSIKDEIDTFSGCMTVKEYVELASAETAEIINEDNFSSDIRVLSAALGRMFNYYGRRSICEMYAVDYEDFKMDDNIVLLLKDEKMRYFNDFMKGWFEDSKIKILAYMYSELLYSLFKKYELI